MKLPPLIERLRRDPATGKMIGILTDAQAREIKWYLREGNRGRKKLPWHFKARLAKLFGVSAHTINEINKRRRYRRVKIREKKPKCSKSDRANRKGRAAK